MKKFTQWLKENYDFENGYDPRNQVLSDDEMLRIAKSHKFDASKNLKGGVDIKVPWSKRTNDPIEPWERGYQIHHVTNRKELRDALGY